MDSPGARTQIDPYKDLIDAQQNQNENFYEEKGSESGLFADEVEGLVVGLHGEVKKVNAVYDRGEDVVQGVEGGVFQHNDVHVQEAEHNHCKLPKAGGLDEVDLLVEARLEGVDYVEAGFFVSEGVVDMRFRHIEPLQLVELLRELAGGPDQVIGEAFFGRLREIKVGVVLRGCFHSNIYIEISTSHYILQPFSCFSTTKQQISPVKLQIPVPMSLERISEEKLRVNQSGEEDESQEAVVSFQASAGRLISKKTENELKASQSRRSIKIKFPQYQRFSRYAISRSGGLGRFDSLVEREDTEIQISPLFAWLLLLMNIIANSLVPCWLMSNLSKEPHTRNSWRFLIITLLTVPMVAYEKRRIEAVGGNIFQLITGDLIRQNYIMAVNFSIQYWFIIQAINMTSLNHAVTFIGLKYYIISLVKYYKKRQHHQFVKAGLILVTLAIVLMMGDSFLNTNYADASPTIPENKYLRLAGDIFSLAGSVVSAFLFEEYQFPEEPRFLNLFFQNLFICFNYVCFGYYFGGSELSSNEYYGVFGLFDSSNFVTIFYVGIMLGMNLILSNIMLYEIYSPFILEIANSFVPLVSALLYRILGLELVPAYTYLGYGFLVPGMILILSGENASKEGEVKMNFIVYKPENPGGSSQQQRNTPIQLQDFSKYRKISFDLSPNKPEKVDKEDSNMSL